MIIFLFCLFLLRLNSSGIPGGIYSTFSFSARALSLGQAYTGIAEGGGGFYFNPASVRINSKREIEVFWIQGFLGNAGSVSLVNPTNGWAFDLNFIQSPEGTETDFIGNVIGTFREKKFQFGFGRSYNLKKDKYAGWRFKLLRDSILDESSFSFGLDFGFFWDVFSRKNIDEVRVYDPLTIGVRIQNLIPPSLKLGEEKEVFKTNLRFGEALRFKNGKIILTFDQSIDGMKYFYWYAGCEFNILKSISFRIGKNFKETSFGFSINADSFVIEYSRILHEISTNDIFSIRINLGWTGSILEKKLKEKEKALRELEKALKERKEEEFKVEVSDFEKQTAKEKLPFIWEIYHRGDYTKALAEILKLSKYLEGDMEYEELYHLIKAQIFIKHGKYRQAKSVLYEGLVINPESRRLLNMIKRIDKLIEYIGK